MRKPAYLMILVFFASSVLFGQSAQPALDSAEKKAAIDALCENLEREYIFPEITEKYVRMLRDNLQSGKYDRIGQPQEFAASITNDLMAVHRDLHLSVRFNPNWVKDEKNRKELDERAIRIQERRSRTSNYLV